MKFHVLRVDIPRKQGVAFSNDELNGREVGLPYSGEARTRKLKEMFSYRERHTKQEIFQRLRLEGLIGLGLSGWLQGQLILRRVQPLKEPRDVIGYYFSKGDDGKYCFTYAGGQDF